MKRKTGTYDTTTVAGEKAKAFVPKKLPPTGPKLDIDKELLSLLSLAEQSLEKLNLAGEMVPSLDWFIYAYVRKEAVTSSQIEGTQATLMDLLSFEAADTSKETSNPDIEEICNYLEAIQFARKELKKPKGLPLSVRLLNETHKRLMTGARGHNKQPGQIRTNQNWIGGTRPGNAVFIPPPPVRLSTLLGDLEKYIHSEDKLHNLIRIALLHVQFETIHPYLDGNGRIGRLLITLLMEHWGFLKQPLLYLSLYFKKHRNEYYRLLDDVRLKGDWESWVKFFLKGVVEISNEATDLAKDLFALVASDQKKVLQNSDSTILTMKLFEILPTHPIITMPQVVKKLETSKPTAIKIISTLESLGILKETSGKMRDRTYSYFEYLEQLKSGTELK